MTRNPNRAALPVRSRPGICPEVTALLHYHWIPWKTQDVLRAMMPARQIAVVRTMIGLDDVSYPRALSLLARTPRDMLEDEVSENLACAVAYKAPGLAYSDGETRDEKYNEFERRYGIDQLDLVLAKGCLKRLLANPRVVDYLANRHPDILAGFREAAGTRRPTKTEAPDCSRARG